MEHRMYRNEEMGRIRRECANCGAALSVLEISEGRELCTDHCPDTTQYDLHLCANCETELSAFEVSSGFSRCIDCQGLRKARTTWEEIREELVRLVESGDVEGALDRAYGAGIEDNGGFGE